MARMPQSLSAVYIHLVFSTKNRRPLLRDKPTRDALHSYLGGVSKQLDGLPHIPQDYLGTEKFTASFFSPLLLTSTGIFSATSLK